MQIRKPGLMMTQHLLESYCNLLDLEYMPRFHPKLAQIFAELAKLLA